MTDRQCCETLIPTGFAPAGGYCYYFNNYFPDAEYDVADRCVDLGTPGIELTLTTIQGDTNFEALLQNGGGKHYYDR